ncbi:MAG: AraC family transcriptional regulator [Firmicutes bacterium HGW-Firmicutes-7]|nr:MAG: AraC family transcriptional regulator [Firmicutes bacterium HGW-Firmicutes-7]
MNYEIILGEQQKQNVLSIRTKTKLEELPTIIGEAYGKIMQYLNELGLTPNEAPFTAYYNLDMTDLDVEMGFPVANQLQGKDDIKATIISAGRCISCMHKGPYSQMEAPYMEMEKWLQENGYEATGICYEYYYNSPMDVEESELLTKIVMPLK